MAASTTPVTDIEPQRMSAGEPECRPLRAIGLEPLVILDQPAFLYSRKASRRLRSNLVDRDADHRVIHSLGLRLTAHCNIGRLSWRMAMPEPPDAEQKHQDCRRCQPEPELPLPLPGADLALD